MTVIRSGGGSGVITEPVAMALVVAGVTEWAQVAADMGIDQVLLMDEAGRAYLTPAMAARIEWQERPQEVIIVPPSTGR